MKKETVVVPYLNTYPEGGGFTARMDSDMTEGNIWMHMIRFSVPMAIGLLFQQLYNTVDTLVVGQFVGKQAQAAVGSTGPIINTVVGFCAGLAWKKCFLVKAA